MGYHVSAREFPEPIKHQVDSLTMTGIGSEYWQKRISDGAERIGIHVEPMETEQFAAHARELIRWNRKSNLTAITDPYEIAIKHFIDSLAPVNWIPDGAALLDIGSGGGFPGIPLKIMIPTLRVTLIDASRKKVSFLKHVIRSLGLDGIDAYHIRAEDYTGPVPGNAQFCSHRKRFRFFDVIISRALTALDRFVALATPLLAENGIIIALKGKLLSDELASLDYTHKSHREETPKRPFSLEIKKYILPMVEAERSIVLLRRAESTEVFKTDI